MQQQNHSPNFVIGRLCIRSTLLVVTTLVMIHPAASFAANWVVQPSVSVSETFNDNFNLDPLLEDSVLTSSLIGALKLSWRSDVSVLRSTLRGDFTTYSGEDRNLKDTNNQALAFGYLGKGERSEWGVGGTVKNDTLLRKADIVTDPDDVTIEPDDDVDDGLVRQNVERLRYTISPHWSRRLTELTGINASYQLSSTEYDNVGATNLFDFQQHTVSLGLSRQLTPKDSFQIGVGGLYYRADTVNRDYDSYSVNTGLVHNFTETVKGGISLGARQTSFDVPGDSGDDNGFDVRIDGSKRTGLTIFSGRLGRGLRASGSGDVVQTDEAVFNVSREISPLLRFSMRTRLFENESLRRNNSNANRRFFSLSPRLRWNITRWWSLDTNYRYRREKRFNEPGAADANSFHISINYSRPTALDE